MANHAKILNTEIKVGDTVRLDYKIIESEKVSGVKKREQKEQVRERFQPFEGTVIAIDGNSKSFTVRKIGAMNIGVERIFPFETPWIGKLTVVKNTPVRRAKLYYFRHAQPKSR